MKKPLLFLLIFMAGSQLRAQNYKLLIGTYTNKGNSEGIYVFDFNSKTAKTTLQSVTKNVINPSYLAINANGKYVYVVNENGENSMVSAFAFNKISGDLTFLNKKPAAGADPCFIAVDNNNVLVANYTSGSLVTFKSNPNGTLTDAKQIIKHSGKSIDSNKRQESSHVHQVQLTPDKKHVVATDLGEDQLYVYHYNLKHPDAVLNIKTVIKTMPGSGPRHLTFSPNGKFAYLTHEFNGLVTAFAYANGIFNKIEEQATTQKSFKGKIDAADIHVTADGKFLYQTNRGDANSISTFKVLADGKLSLVETISTLGIGPRNFTIDPSGNFLLVAHQYTNDVIIFNRDKETGKLSNSGKKINIGSPVCLVFSK